MQPPSFRIENLTQHQRGLSRLAAVLISDWHGGEDLAQEAALRALSASSPPHGMGWFRVSIGNLARNEQRSRSRRGERERSVARAEATPSSSEVAERMELARLVQDAIEAQTPEHASVLRDHYIGELTLRQIAVRDNVSLNTVKSRLRRAKEELRHTLERRGMNESQHWSVGLAPLALPFWPQQPLHAARLAHLKALSHVSSWIAMKKLVAIVSVVLFAAVLAKVVPAVIGPEGPQGVEWVASDAEANEPLEESTIGKVALETTREAISIRPGSAESGQEGRSTRLQGTVLDFDEEPLADVKIRLEGKAFLHRELAFDQLIHGTTDALGRFDLSLPFHPEAAWRMSFTPDAVHLPHTLLIGPYGPQAEASLEPGTRVLAPLVLLSAATATGQVVDSRGRPLGGVSVQVSPTSPQTIDALLPSHQTQTDVDGRFRLGRVRPGSMRVSVASKGFTTQHLPDVQVAADRNVSLGQIELAVAPVIRGRLVDENDEGLPADEVWLKPLEGQGPRVMATTAADGHFTAFLEAEGPHVIQVRKEGYEPLSAPGDPNVIVNTGVENAVLRLLSSARTTYRVTDADSGRPVEQFSIYVVRNGGSQSLKTVVEMGGHRDQRARPRGVAVLSGRPGLDLVKVDAAGYLPVELDVAHETPENATQRIELQRGHSVTGVVQFDGTPVDGAWVVLRGSETRGRGEVGTPTDDLGRFTFAGLPSGQYQISAMDQGGRRGQGRLAFTIRGEERPVPGSPKVLDPIDLQGMGSVEGRVDLPAGVQPEGLTVTVTTGDDEIWYALQPDRTFRIPHVDARTHEIQLSTRAGELEGVPPARVEVQRGKTVSIRIDATEYGAARSPNGR